MGNRLTDLECISLYIVSATRDSDRQQTLCVSTGSQYFDGKVSMANENNCFDEEASV